ncbi:MAG: ribosome maturation factor RimM [Negativicutes bacterium]|jgi:16S rRNA processing protein RimM
MANNLLIKIGIITSAHGITGDVNVKALTDFPQRFKQTKTVLIDDNEYNIVSAAVTSERVILRFAEVSDRNSAEKLRGKYLCVTESATVRLPKGNYYIYDIVDCEVYEDGVLLGIVKDVLSTGSNDVYVVESQTGQLLIPALKQVVKVIDIANKRLDVKRLSEL